MESGVYRLVIVGVHLLVVLSLELLGLGHEGSFLLHVQQSHSNVREQKMFHLKFSFQKINRHSQYILQQGIAVRNVQVPSIKQSYERTDFNTELNMGSV